MRVKLVVMMMALLAVLTACTAPTATPRPIGPTATERPLPTFGPTRTPTPTRTPRPSATAPTADTTRPTLPAAAETNTPEPVQLAMGSASAQRAPAGKIARAQAPAVLRSALIKAGVAEPQVYWFTFDEGDREQALMIQYRSPLRWQPGYAEMLRAAKETLGRYFLQIDPPLYTGFIAAVDMTGTSDTVQRLRRSGAEKLARGEIGAEDFLNNYFDPAPVVITCAASGECLGKMATPFPTFNFPNPFPTPAP